MNPTRPTSGLAGESKAEPDGSNSLAAYHQRGQPYFPHSERNQFLELGAFRPIPNSRNFEVTERIVYVDPDGNVIVMEVGDVTDFASVPPLARFAVLVALVAQFLSRWHWEWYILEAFAAWVCYIAEWLENSGTDQIAAIHDKIFQTRCRSFQKANWILFQGMVAKGATKNSMLKRLLFYINVQLFGIFPWINDARKRNKK